MKVICLECGFDVFTAEAYGDENFDSLNLFLRCVNCKSHITNLKKHGKNKPVENIVKEADADG